MLAARPTHTPEQLAEWRMMAAAGTLNGRVQGPPLPPWWNRGTGLFPAARKKLTMPAPPVSRPRVRPLKLLPVEAWLTRSRTDPPEERVPTPSAPEMDEGGSGGS